MGRGTACQRFSIGSTAFWVARRNSGIKMSDMIVRNFPTPPTPQKKDIPKDLPHRTKTKNGESNELFLF